jgi:hypothetical protein
VREDREFDQSQRFIAAVRRSPDDEVWSSPAFVDT